MDTGRFTVNSQEDMTTWREVRVCFLLSSGFDSALLGYHIAKLLRGEVIWVEMLVSLPLSRMKNLGV